MEGFGAAVASFKLGEGGMTGLAKRVLAEYNGDRLFGTCVKSIEQSGDEAKVRVNGGEVISARRMVCTIPL